MPTLHLLCGLPGSGKTTLACHLEKQSSALRFSEDEWLGQLYGAEFALDDDKRFRIKQQHWSIAERVLPLGIDVILDWSFLLRSERDDFRGRGAAFGANVQIHYLDVPLDQLKIRLAIRNQQLGPHTFPVTTSLLLELFNQFEPPTVDELE